MSKKVKQIGWAVVRYIYARWYIVEAYKDKESAGRALGEWIDSSATGEFELRKVKKEFQTLHKKSVYKPHRFIVKNVEIIKYD